MTDLILTLNAGSTSLKFAAYRAEREPVALLRGSVAGIGDAATLSIEGEAEAPALDVNDLRSAIELVRRELARWNRNWRLRAVAHRVVHGGAAFHRPAVIDGSVVKALEALVPFAPLHQPASLVGVRVLIAANPDVLHIACFDTAFHATLGPSASTLPLPQALRESGLRRYGFHGLSCEAVLHRLRSDWPLVARGRLVVAHLGGGASVTAIAAGRSVATSMGLTALDGVPMSTRSGAIDPGAVLHLARVLGVDDTERLLYREAGLKGLSGLSGDVRVLRASPSPAAAMALDIFADRVAEAVAAMSVPLGGLDALVFTGGIGANDATMCADVIRRLAHLQPFQVMSLNTDEEGVMARAAAAALFGEPNPINHPKESTDAEHFQPL